MADLSKLTAPTQEVLTTVQELSRLALSNFEKMSALQFSSFQRYLELALKQYKDALEIKDAKGLEAYVQGQAELAKLLSDTLVSDAKQLAKLGLEYQNDAQKLTQEKFGKFVRKAA